MDPSTKNKDKKTEKTAVDRCMLYPHRHKTETNFMQTKETRQKMQDTPKAAHRKIIQQIKPRVSKTDAQKINSKIWEKRSLLRNNIVLMISYA
jgi:hypothetical protein